MLSGINADIEYGGKIYHVQTEDRGVNNPAVTTQLFLGGTIISTKKTSYADILKVDCLNDVVRDLMKDQHRSMVKDLLSGRFNLEKKKDIKDITETNKEVAPEKKGLDDVILDYLSSDEEDK